MARPFTTAEPGTPEHVWLADPRWDGCAAFDPADLHAGRVVVLAAHPDDETLGVGATIAALADGGCEVLVVVATDGEGSHPNSTLWSHELLARTRRDELAHAVDVLAPGARVVHLGLPDGGLGELADDLAAQLRDALPEIDGRREVILAPYAEDGHIDHDTLGAVAQVLAVGRESELWQFPIWLWHWGTPADVPWPDLVQVQPSAAALHRKARALSAHHSQIDRLSPLPGDDVLLPPHVLTHFGRVVETLIRTRRSSDPDPSKREAQRCARRAEGFDRMLTGDDDPWASTSTYERRKHALTAAVLPRERYGEIVEIGCSTGALTARLTARADHITALDGSTPALAVAERRGLPRVDWICAQLPDGLADLPDDSADLVLVSEVAYFLTGPELLALLRHARRLLRPGGEIAFVDWQEGSTTLPLDGGLVHAQVDSALADLGRRVDYVDDSIRIGVWGGAPIRPDAS